MKTWTEPQRRKAEQMKAQHPGFLLLFREGSDYVAVGEDARLVYRLAGSPLGPLPKLREYRLHATLREKTIHALIGAGHRVALCEQVPEPDPDPDIIVS